MSTSHARSPHTTAATNSSRAAAVLLAAVVLTLTASLTVQLSSDTPLRTTVGALITLVLLCAGAWLRHTAQTLVGDAVLALGALSVFGWVSALITAIPAVAQWLTDTAPAAAFVVVNATKLSSVLVLGIIMLACGWRPQSLLLVRGRLNAPTGIKGVSWGWCGPLVIVVLAALFLTDPGVIDSVPSAAQLAPVLVAVLPLLLAGPFINAVCEEVIYRHALVPTMSPIIGTGLAVLVSSVIFGLGHITGSPGGWTGVIFTFVYGLVSAWAMQQSRGMFWNTTIHFFGDLAAISAITLTVHGG